MRKVAERGEVSNSAESTILSNAPYTIDVTISGTTDLLFHAWSCEAVAAKAGEKKGSAAKRTDNLESYVYRTAKGELALPGEYFRQSIINAAKFFQDPRSSRPKQACDLIKSAVVVTPVTASLGKTTWDALDMRRVVIQRSGITRTRPLIKEGWKANFTIMVLLPNYLEPGQLREMVDAAGSFIGVADFRPTYGRYCVVSWDVKKLAEVNPM
jgi:hypothetical protein